MGKMTGVKRRTGAADETRGSDDPRDRWRRSKPLDIIYLHELRIETVIGVFDWERRIKQVLSLDLEMAANVHRAAASDNLADTLDYKAVAKRLIGFVGESEFHLIETVAERVAELVLDEFQVSWLRLRVSKPGAVRSARDVGVIIERGRRE
jgi:dihydroneopterin aldolase